MLHLATRPLVFISLALSVLGGCSFLIDPIFDPASNAYTCECSCGAGPRDRTLAIAASEGDGAEARNNARVDLGANTLLLGQELVALRFDGIAVPSGALITSAQVRFTAAASGSGISSGQIRIEDDANAPPLTEANSSLSGRITLATNVNWAIPDWNGGDSSAAQTTEDLSTLIQPIVDLAGWTSGNAVLLLFDQVGNTREAVSFDGDPAAAPLLEITYIDPAETTAARLPICVAADDNPHLNPNAPDPDGVDEDGDGLPDILAADCAGRVQDTFRGMVGGCGYIDSPASSCSCNLVPTGFFDSSNNNQLDPDDDEPYYGFAASACNEDCGEELLQAPGCDNFDPNGFTECVQPIMAVCVGIGLPPEDCDISACGSLVSATNAPGDAPVCTPYGANDLTSLSFALFGRRSTCEVGGVAEIEVGEDGREPKKDPSTIGTLEIWGDPCPGQSCLVGLAGYSLGMNPITFDVKFASDPTFRDLTQAGESFLGAAQLDIAGAGTLASDTAFAVSRGRRGSDRVAVESTNSDPVDLSVDWSTLTCGLEGNLGRMVDSEDLQGVCAGDGETACQSDSECDAAGGPCELPDENIEPLSIAVALSGDLVNQPPTAAAGASQTVECTSPAGASFLLDGSASSDPDENMAIVSWREGSRTGPEVGFDPIVSQSLATGTSQSYVLRVIDAFAQSDEDTTGVQVVDTTPPVIECNAPATIVPPDGLDEDEPTAEPVSFTATATDVCDASVAATILDFDCYAIKGRGKLIDKTDSCVVEYSEDTIIILNGGGIGTEIVWVVEATDDAGNVATTTCGVQTVKKPRL
jgi:hypothetical protein